MWKSAFSYNFNEKFTKIDLYSKIIIPTCNRMQSPNIFKQYYCPNKQTFCLVYTHSLSWQSLIRLSTKNNNFQYLCRQNKNQKHALYYLFTTLLLFSIQTQNFSTKSECTNMWIIIYIVVIFQYYAYTKYTDTKLSHHLKQKSIDN